jgi:PTH2 family peptidyl-tRNA hydrolase
MEFLRNRVLSGSVSLTTNEREWLEGTHAKVVVGVDSEAALLELIERATEQDIQCWRMIDNGLTEFHGVPTLTCAAFGPDLSDKLDVLTGTLKLR